MDLIERAAAIETLGEPHPLDYNRISAVEKIRGLPSVDAISIDKLCEWLAEQDYEIYCFMCKEVFDTGGGCPNQVSGSQWKCGCKEHWKAFLTKVMEGWKDETGS